MSLNDQSGNSILSQSHVVRGYGPLDLFLAKKRCKIAARYMKSVLRRERVLDIGCGSYPLFLTKINFEEKYGLDKMAWPVTGNTGHPPGIIFVKHDIENKAELPFREDFFDVVTMLAVFEHIEPDKLINILKEIRRILKPGGRFFLTTPAPRADKLLRFMAKCRLISSEEIDEHKSAYNHTALIGYMEKAGFAGEKMKSGYFELFLNIWFYADK